MPRLSEILATIPLVADAARAEDHKLPISKQLTHGGEKAKIIAVARIFGNKALDYMFSDRVSGILPFDGTLSERPISYGTEAVVYSLVTSEERFVVKLFNNPENAVDQIRTYQKWQEQTSTFFGEQFEPVQFLMGQNPFRRKHKIAIGIQKFVDGTDFFVQPTVASESEIALFANNVASMHDATGLVPDLSGIGNVLVNKSGAIRIIDGGFPLDPASDDAFIRSRLHVLNEVAASCR